VKLADKAAIVTGGDTGIGKAISIALAQEGAKVVIDYHGDRKPAEDLMANIQGFGGKAISVPADVSKPDEVDELVREAAHAFGGLDILVNNAGIEEKHPHRDAVRGVQ
jgi:NAD(P)-dependent dehydrogenase (short-subunit alcohol dehydrogenase family)